MSFFFFIWTLQPLRHEHSSPWPRKIFPLSLSKKKKLDGNSLESISSFCSTDEADVKMHRWQKSKWMHFWWGLHHLTVRNHFTTFPPGRLMSFRSCCAPESPGGGGGGGGNQRLHPSLHQVTPCIHDWEPRNSSLTRWIVMKFCTGTALKSGSLINPWWLEFRGEN